MNLEAERFADRYKYDEDFRIQTISLKEKNPVVYRQIMTKIEHTELKMASEYYFDKFQGIEDELYILGMSPNNDGHIFKCIEKNSKLKKVYIYCYSQEEKDFILNNLSSTLFKGLDVSQLWKRLNCEKKNFRCNYKIPAGADKFMNVFNALSDDKIEKDEMIREANKVPQFEVDRLCKLVKEDMLKRNPAHTSVSEAEFNESNASISYIALQEGILPSVLYMFCVMNFDKIKD